MTQEAPLCIAQFGAGRIGQIHASNIAVMKDARLRYVVDVNLDAAQKLAARYGAKAVSEREAFADREVDAVLIASSTDTHARLAIEAARAGKAIFCEKPIDLSLKKVDQCLAEVEKAGVPMFVGFNRRFDPSFAALKRRLDAGEVGAVEQVVISSRDPGPPPLAYVKVSGGMFRDMTIHDFDMARWLLGEEPVEVFAMGECLIDRKIGAAGDIDSAMVLLRTASDRMCHINNSRRALYGYDQRIEVAGATGMLRAENLGETTVEHFTAKGTVADRPLDFFLERYADAYRAEMASFLLALKNRQPMPVGARDGRQALVLAEAALKSHKKKVPVKIGNG
ncbi:MAG TPA: inositol 2-dehydrogenase [Burkholderiales bacterium]|nr:inositol 2-dehydrogenase [Burkholderiales bacterium]